MRLADLIDENGAAILAEWDSFASSLLPAAAGLDTVTLRDHAGQILLAIAHTPLDRVRPLSASFGLLAAEKLRVLRLMRAATSSATRANVYGVHTVRRQPVSVGALPRGA